ncbi:MAG: hypothetical protein ACI8TX_003232 [Hyphomicrobiaceae bacterium]|jgi:hypothetical protein
MGTSPSLANPIPVCFAVDVEPDPRQVDLRNREPWRGFELFQAWFDRLRDELLRDGLGTVPTAWLLRLDPQIRIAYGDGAWGARTYAAQFENFLERGDEIGAHVHLYRPCDDGNGWIVDNDDPAWAKVCVRESLASYREAFGTDCQSISIGDRTLDQRLLAIYEDERVRYDFTVEPGLHGIERMFPWEASRGVIPNFEGMPRDPWRPARDNFAREDRANGYPTILCPLATFRFPAAFELGRRVHQLGRRWQGRLVSEDHRRQRWVRLCMTYRPWFFEFGLSRVSRKTALKVLHFVVRSDLPFEPDLQRNLARNIRRIAADPRFRFVSPEEAVQLACPDLYETPRQTRHDPLHGIGVLA